MIPASRAADRGDMIGGQIVVAGEHLTEHEPVERRVGAARRAYSILQLRSEKLATDQLGLLDRYTVALATQPIFVCNFHMKLVDKYRPRKFRDVIGQDHAVKVLSRLIIAGRHRRHMLLHGPIGSGKTTLARIYGRALNCENNEEDGSPCGKCSQCADSKLYFLEYDGTSIGQDVSQIVKGVPAGQILFIDEAHALGGRLEQLLVPLNEGNADFTLILATSKPQLIPAAVVSRLWNIPLYSMSIGESVRFLKKIADREGITVEDEALHLLAGQCEGQARDLLHALDQAQLNGTVALDSVRDQLGISFSEAAARYLEALASGSYGQQAKAFYEWNESGAQKLGFIQNFLASIYFRETQKLNVTVDARLGAIPAAERQRIVDAWRERIGEVAFSAYLRSLIEFWPVVMPDLADTAINLHIARFHKLVNRVPGTGPAKTPQSPRQRTKRVTKNSNPAYLSFEEIRSIINSSSAMTQEYSLVFNAKITIWHQGFGIHGIAAAALLAKEFHGFLRNPLAQFEHGSGFRISVMGIDNHRGPWTRIVAAVPVDRMGGFRDRIVNWRKDAQSGPPPAIECDVIAEGQQRYKYHRACVRWLCEGIDPELQGKSGERLADLLNIKPKQRRSFGDIGSHNRVQRTAALLDRSQNELAANKMTYLLPFESGEFDQVLESWELDEHPDRKELQRKRARDIDELKVAYEHDPAAFDGAKAKLAATWDDNPRNRDRRWPTWWQTEPL